MLTDTDERVQGPTPRWVRRWSLPFLLVIGWLVYELTAQPALGVAAVCLKYGWEDFRTARWLRRIDPNAARGWTCCLLSTAQGLLRVSFTATVLFILILGLPRAAQNRGFDPNNLPPQVVGGIATAATGWTLATAAVLLAIGIAWRHRLRLWLNSATLRAARERNVWPSKMPYQMQANETAFVVTALMLVAYPVLFIVAPVIAVPWAADWSGLAPQQVWAMAFGPAIISTAMLVGAILLAKLGDIVQFRVTAHEPRECWRPNDPGEGNAHSQSPEPQT